MPLTRYIIFIILLAFLGCQPGSKKEVKYYANLVGVVSPYLEYTPQGEITRSEADSLGHYYVFTYQNHKLSEISFFKRNHPSSQSYFKTHKVVYSYYNDGYSRSYFDEFGRKSNMWRHYYQGGNIHHEYFDLNTNGDKIALILKDSTGQQVPNGDGVYKYSWSQHADDEVVQEHFDSIGNPTIFRTDIPFERLILKTDDNGFSSSISRLGSDNKVENHPTEAYATLHLFFY